MKNAPAVLLIHGFTSHRSSLEALIPELEEQGIEWHYPILAGHGTSPVDLKDKRWEDWQRDVEQGYRYLRAAHDQVAIVALSMGALLGLELTAAHGDHVSGLVLISPCLRFKNRLSKFTPVISKVMQRFPNPSPSKFSSKEFARHDKGYAWFPTQTYRSFWERTGQMKDVIRSIHRPVRIIHSHNDRVADPKGAQEIYHLLTSPKELLWHETSGHEMLLDAETQSVVQQVLATPFLTQRP